MTRAEKRCFGIAIRPLHNAALVCANRRDRAALSEFGLVQKTLPFSGECKRNGFSCFWKLGARYNEPLPVFLGLQLLVGVRTATRDENGAHSCGSPFEKCASRK